MVTCQSMDVDFIGGGDRLFGRLYFCLIVCYFDIVFLVYVVVVIIVVSQTEEYGQLSASYKKDRPWAFYHESKTFGD